jgi:hypothetical protein
MAQNAKLMATLSKGSGSSAAAAGAVVAAVAVAAATMTAAIVPLGKRKNSAQNATRQ